MAKKRKSAPVEGKRDPVSRAVLSTADAFGLPSFIALEADRNRFQAAEQDGLLLLTADAINADSIDVTLESNGEKFALTVTPPLCLGFFAATAQSLPQLEQIRSFFEGWSGRTFPAPVVVDDSRALKLLLAARLVEQSGNIAAHTTSLARDLFHLRAAHEVMQNDFAKIETLLYQGGRYQAQLCFGNQPAGYSTAPDARQIRQLLPVNTLGIVAIDLHVLPSDNTDDAAIEIKLNSHEDGICQASWVLNAAQCRAGWISLILPKMIAGIARTPELVITPLADFTRLPVFSLGVPQSLSRFYVCTDNVSEPRSLALRCWGGLPGAALPAGGILPLSAGGSGNFTQLAFPRALRATAKRLCSVWQEPWEVVFDLPEKNGVFCHPPPLGIMPEMTVAMIEWLTVNRRMRITATGVVNNDQSKPVEFALAAAPPGVDAMAYLLGAVPEGLSDFHLAGWARASFEEPALLTLILPPCALQQRLFLVTRMADGEQNSYAQASFEDMKIALWPVAETAELTGLPVDTTDLARVITPPGLSENPAAYELNGQALLCYPLASGINLGVIPALVPQAMAGVRANVKLAVRHAMPVEFAIALTALSGAEVLAQVTSGEDSNSNFAFSGWLRVGATAVNRLEVSAAGLAPLATAGDRYNLYVLARTDAAAERGESTGGFFSNIEILQPDRLSL